MSDLPSVILKLDDSEIFPDEPVSEALEAKLGQNINALIDRTDDYETRITALETEMPSRVAMLLVATITGLPNNSEYTLYVLRNGANKMEPNLRVRDASGALVSLHPIEASPTAVAGSGDTSEYLGPYIFSPQLYNDSGTLKQNVKIYKLVP